MIKVTNFIVAPNTVAPSSGLSAYDTPFYKGAAHLDKLHPPSLEEEKPAKPEHEDPAEEARRFEELLVVCGFLISYCFSNKR